ncbi:MAG: 3-deoxy-7-phosphoheptulonate synthase [Fimbriimonadaceae bacterium]|nr:3-deoxy-7-phosphoheptulonate synthase [Fimbriimonadaceae bacterium]
MQRPVDDLRIQATRPLLPPAILIEEVPQGASAAETVASSRESLRDILLGVDDRIAVFVGPCSVHDVDAALEFAQRLKPHADRLAGDLFVVMRAYFEKPRTVGGWKGLINDPDLDESFRINKGLRLARTLLRDITDLGLPCATEFLDTTVPQHIADFVSWGAIGARTVESQTHRELASGLSMPVGFKNCTDGRIQPAVDAVQAARMPHWFPSATKDGVAALSYSTGNDCGHVVLRGGAGGPNYDAETVAATSAKLGAAGLPSRVVVDCSHGNSGKDPERQKVVMAAVAAQVAGGSPHVMGVMLESHLVGGRQDYVPGQAVYGQSVTDACLAFDETVPLLDELAAAVRRARS